MGRRKIYPAFNNSSYENVQKSSSGEAEGSASAFVFYLVFGLISAFLIADCYNFHIDFPAFPYGFHLAFLGPLFVIVLAYLSRFAVWP